MKKISYILTAALTFFLSATIYFVYLNFEINKSKSLIESVESSSLPLISTCDVLNNLDLFENRNVRIKGDLFVAFNSTSFYIENSEKDCGAIALSPVFWNDNDEYLNRLESAVETKELLNHLGRMCSKNFISVVEVEIVGKIPNEIRKRTEKYKNNFEIRVKEIKQLSPIRSQNLDLPEWFRKANCKTDPNLCYCR